MTKNKIGAFWKKVLPDGRTVYNGSIKDGEKTIRMNLWVNEKKTNPKQPDLNAILDTWIPKTKVAAIEAAKSETK